MRRKIFGMNPPFARGAGRERDGDLSRPLIVDIFGSQLKITAFFPTVPCKPGRRPPVAVTALGGDARNSSLSTGSGYAEVAYARPREYFATLNFDF
jgi:hypothetical protein